jgi:hypothetical protein
MEFDQINRKGLSGTIMIVINIYDQNQIQMISSSSILSFFDLKNILKINYRNRNNQKK